MRVATEHKLLVAITAAIVKREFSSHFPLMQLSIKTPPELTLPILKKCAEMGERFPSSFATTCVWQCLKLMNLPHHRDEPLDIVERYYRAVGRENEIWPQTGKKREMDTLLQGLAEKDRAKRAKESRQRLAEFQAQLKKQPPSKHLHLKISEGIDELPKRIKEKAAWLRISPNALVTACLRDCLQAMDDSNKALVSPHIVVDFWAVSHAKSRRRATGAIEAMVMKNIDGTLRQRGGPILDTIVRLTLAEQWDVTLEQILRDADVMTEKREFKP